MVSIEPDSGSQATLDGVAEARGLLDTLLAQSRLYRTSADYMALLDFVVRLRNFAPFNAMLLQMQKPGLRYAASEADWRIKFERKPKEGARPLLILWPFGPVALVYDAVDTEGKELPQDVAAFHAHGPIGELEIADFRGRTNRRNIQWEDLDAGDAKAGSIRCVKRAAEAGEKNAYRMFVNKNHAPAVRFVTLTHELAHLFLGHLGLDEALHIPGRSVPEHRPRELEAESVAFIVCNRNGVSSKSQTYLKSFVEADSTADDLDIYRILWAAGRIETLLGLGARTAFDPSRGAK